MPSSTKAFRVRSQLSKALFLLAWPEDFLAILCLFMTASEFSIREMKPETTHKAFCNLKLFTEQELPGTVLWITRVT